MPRPHGSRVYQVRGEYMLFRKYHLVVFKDREFTRQVKLHGGLLVFFFVLLIGLGASTAYLWGAQYKALQLESQLEKAQKTVLEHENQVVSMAGKLQLLQTDLQRIQQFDSKLRVMMNLEHDPTDISGNTGGPMPGYLGQGLPVYRQELLARRVHGLLDQLRSDTTLEEVRQQELLHSMRANRDILAATPSIWPVEGYLTSSFGRRASPFGAGSDFHKGIDIANKVGTPIVTPAKGRITSAGWEGGYGNCIVINHGNDLSTRYAHMQNIHVKVGDTVERGDLIGTVGSTGRSTGPHLHYEVRLGGISVNPMHYILD